MKPITVTLPAEDLVQRIAELEITIETLQSSITNLLERIATLEGP